MRSMRRMVACLVLMLAGALVGATDAAAHPLGNFTINTFSSLDIARDRIVIHHVVDMAEIPTFQELERIDADGDGINREEIDRYARSAAAEIAARLDLRVGGEAVGPTVVDSSAALGPGRGGLDVLRLETRLVAPLESPQTSIEYRDRNFEGRLGWREIIARPIGGQGISSSTVPRSSISDGLRSYPAERLSSPSDVTSAQVRVEPGAAGGAPDATGGAGEVKGDRERAFASLIEDAPSPFAGVAFLLAFAFGAAHALGPGHGKAIMAAYLVGAEGRARDAVGVGVAVSLMHTLSVVALGMVTLWASSLFPPESVYPWLSFASGAVVLALGAGLLRARLRARKGGSHDHGHPHDHAHSHDHGHAHDHDQGRAHHHHRGRGSGVLSWKGLAAIAVSGGLLPSPSALVVLLGAVALNRVGYGVALVGAFSIGLAAALTVIGLLVLKARRFAARRMSARVAGLIPVLSAAAVTMVGAALTARAVVNL